MVKQHVSQSHTTDRSHSRFKGARKQNWVSEIRLPNSQEKIWLGSYNTAEKASRAFDPALFCLRGHSDKTHSEQSTSGFQTESPSLLVSVETVGFDGELAVDESVMDVLTTGSGYEIFPELNDFSSDFLGSWMPNIDFEEENIDGILNPESSLWNF
ncbi:hypothetical protein GQ457_08G032980 [Hibiscus cannabinus]